MLAGDAAVVAAGTELVFVEVDATFKGDFRVLKELTRSSTGSFDSSIVGLMLKEVSFGSALSLSIKLRKDNRHDGDGEDQKYFEDAQKSRNSLRLHSEDIGIYTAEGVGDKHSTILEIACGLLAGTDRLCFKPFFRKSSVVQSRNEAGVQTKSRVEKLSRRHI